MRINRKHLEGWWTEATGLMETSKANSPLTHAIITEALEGCGGDGVTTTWDAAVESLDTIKDDIDKFAAKIFDATINQHPSKWPGAATVAVWPDLRLAIATKALGEAVDVASFEIEGGTCWGPTDCMNAGGSDSDEECPNCRGDAVVNECSAVHDVLYRALKEVPV